MVVAITVSSLPVALTASSTIASEIQAFALLNIESWAAIWRTPASRVLNAA
jgi:hypothetical protein